MLWEVCLVHGCCCHPSCALRSCYVENRPFYYLKGHKRIPVDILAISDIYVSVLVLRRLKLTRATLSHLVEPGQLPKSPALPGASHCSASLLGRVGPF